ncbi:MAG: carotenoid biosynthesis protein, partial [Bacteroidota bacterium]
AIIILVVLHYVGVIGFHLPDYRDLFQSLTPFNLLISLGILAYFHKIWNLNFGFWVFGVFWSGYLVELVGVHTGLLFGDYSYGTTLGPKVAAVPPMMGLLWVLVAYISGILAQNMTSSLWLRVVVGASLMLILDILIEPVAMEYDFWFWDKYRVPLLNYVCWFVIGAIMQYAFHQIHQEKRNPIAYPLYLIQFGFFATFMVVDLAG